MASINSLSGGSSTSSIYGNANILSGLASGMDTEAMIENAVSGIQNKIANLQQDRTMMEWEQEAYRSIIDKMVNFSNKYTSFSSGTNLLSETFFRDALSISTSGKYAENVTASGRGSSSVQILGVKQLATFSTYSVAGIAGSGNTEEVVGNALDLSQSTTVSAITGTIGLQFGNSTRTVLQLNEDDVYNSWEELAAGLNEKLKGTNLEDHVSAKADENGIKFVISSEDIKNGNNLLKISSATGDWENIVGDLTKKNNIHDVTIDLKNKQLTKQVNNKEYLDGKTVSFTLDGETKSITFGKDKDIEIAEDETLETLKQKLSDALTKKFGKDANGQNKITVDTRDGGLVFRVDNKNTGSTLSISGGKVLGLKSDSAATYVNTGMKLSELGLLTDADLVKNEGEGKDGKYKLVIGEKTLGYLDKDATIQDVLDTINKNSDASVTVSFSKMTNRFLFTSKTAGATDISFGDGLAKKLFTNETGENIDKKTGQNAVLSMSVNGEVYDGITRSSNTFEVDGMTITLGGTFNAESFTSGNTMGLRDANGKVIESAVDAAMTNAVSFTSKTDSEKIIDAVKSMIKDYNEMANEIKDAYSTMPLYNSKGQRYEPLTEDDEKDMSDSAVERYNEKAKTGILFGDNNLSSLYNDIRSAMNELGMTNIGISTEYKDGKTTLVLDETKLKEALEKDPETVTSVFTKSRENGAASDGFMTKLKDTMDLYAKTTGKKGILIELAGSPKSALSLLSNTYKTKMDKMDETIERWQDKLADKIDYYNRQFTRLEKLISEMNSQSSSLMGLMGY